MTWTDERTAEMHRMRAQSMSAAKVAEQLGTTKNAVIGKSSRDGKHFAGDSSTRWTEAEKARLADMMEAGLTIDEMRERFPDRTYDAIKRQRWKVRAEDEVRFPKRASMPREAKANRRAGPKARANIARLFPSLPGGPVAPTPSAPAEPAGPDAVPFIKRGFRQCRWPLWGDDARSGLVCGSPARVTSVYCDRHRSVAYRPVCSVASGASA